MPACSKQDRRRCREVSLEQTVLEQAQLPVSAVTPLPFAECLWTMHLELRQLCRRRPLPLLKNLHACILDIPDGTGMLVPVATAAVAAAAVATVVPAAAAAAAAAAASAHLHSLALPLEEACCTVEGVLEQHGNRHGPHTPWHWCDGPSNLLALVKGTVTHQPATQHTQQKTGKTADSGLLKRF
jgi:hypothetical protein